MKRGLDLVKARNFKSEVVDGVLSCSCVGNGCMLRAQLEITQEKTEVELLHKIMCAFADELDPVYEDVAIYDREDSFDVMVGKVGNYMEQNGGWIEASSWTIEQHDEMFRVYCCDEHDHIDEDNLYSSLGEAINSIPCFPDRTFRQQVKWENKLKVNSENT